MYVDHRELVGGRLYVHHRKLVGGRLYAGYFSFRDKFIFSVFLKSGF